MKRKLARKVKKIFKNKVSINFVSHNVFPSFSLNFSLFTFICFVLLFSFFCFRTALDIMTGVDYYMVKADNKILRMKINYLMVKANESFAELEMSRKTESQIRKIIGLDKNFYNNDYFNNYGGPEPQDVTNLKEILKRKSDEINNSQLAKVFDIIKNKSRERISGYEEITWYLTNKYNLSRALPKGWPTTGNITSSFGYRVHPLSFSYEYHSGIDISNFPGTGILATADGVVRYVGWASGYGLSVIIDHGFGYSTLYAHLSEINVKEGMPIRRGEEIGKMGSTGTSTGPHLHYEVWENGVPKNPVKYLDSVNSSNFFISFENMLKVS